MARKPVTSARACAGPRGSMNVPTAARMSQHRAAQYAISIARREVAISNPMRLRWLSGLAIAALSACSPAPPPASPPPKVSVVTLKATPVPITTELPGRVNAFRAADVRPQVNGIVLKRLFVEGSEVKEGETRGFDREVLLAMRHPGDLSPRGGAGVSSVLWPKARPEKGSKRIRVSGHFQRIGPRCGKMRGRRRNSALR